MTPAKQTMPQRPPTYSTALLDSLVCPVLVDSRELQSRLPAWLSLPRLPDVPDGCHPVVIEIWRVQNGLIEYGGRTAHEWWELTGGAAGLGFGGAAGAALGAGMGGAAGAANGAALGMWMGPLGWWFGAAGGGALGAMYGATMAGAAGALYGARLASDAGHRASENSSRIIGTYNEIIVTVPCRLASHQEAISDVALVFGTYTDSSASALGEWLVGWGYRKTLALGGYAKDGALEVQTSSSGEPFRLVTCQASPAPLAMADARPMAASALTALSRPLLGVLPGNRPMISFMDRAFEDQAVRVTPVSMRVESDGQILAGMTVVSADIAPLGDAHAWGAFALTGVPVRLSYPCAVDV